MQKRYLSKKAVAGAPYVPELRSYLVEEAPNGELLDEVEVYGIELLQTSEESKESGKHLSLKKEYLYAGVAVMVVCMLLLLITRD